MNEVHKARLSSRLQKGQEGRRVLSRGHRVQTVSHVLETAVAAQDVAPGLAYQHAVHRQHVQPHLKQDILQRTSSRRTELREKLHFLLTSVQLVQGASQTLVGLVKGFCEGKVSSDASCLKCWGMCSSFCQGPSLSLLTETLMLSEQIPSFMGWKPSSFLQLLNEAQNIIHTERKAATYHEQ